MALNIYYDSVDTILVNNPSTGPSLLTNQQIDGFGALQNGGSAYNYANFPSTISPASWINQSQRRFSIYFVYDPLIYLAQDSLDVTRGVRILPVGFPEN